MLSGITPTFRDNSPFEKKKGDVTDPLARLCNLSAKAPTGPLRDTGLARRELPPPALAAAEHAPVPPPPEVVMSTCTRRHVVPVWCHSRARFAPVFRIVAPTGILGQGQVSESILRPQVASLACVLMLREAPRPDRTARGAAGAGADVLIDVEVDRPPVGEITAGSASGRSPSASIIVTT